MNRNTQKTLLAGIALGLALATGATAQTTTINLRDSELVTNWAFSQPILLGEGDKFECLAAGSLSNSKVYVCVLETEANTLGEEGQTWYPEGNPGQLFRGIIELHGDNRYRTFDNMVFYGPRKIQIQGTGTAGANVTYRVTRNAFGETSSPADAGAAVKIPAGATGDVQVVMESSEDGTTWVLAGPGPYPANGNRRQFRLRVISQ